MLFSFPSPYPYSFPYAFLLPYLSPSQDWLHSLWDSRQNKNVGSSVPKVLRILIWWPQSIKSSVGALFNTGLCDCLSQVPMKLAPCLPPFQPSIKFPFASQISLAWFSNPKAPILTPHFFCSLLTDQIFRYHKVLIIPLHCEGKKGGHYKLTKVWEIRHY